jgi:aryl-alcohol dehydrogenase-like predicted oxidoreductase
MKNENQIRALGNTGLKVGRLGVASSYGAPSEAFEEAFDKGCNYFYLGSGRHRAGMKQAIRNICKKGHRDKLIVAVHNYSRFGFLTERSLKKTLRSLNTEYADLLILGWHNRRPTKMLLDRAVALKEKGLIKCLGMSGHKRTLFPKLASEGIFDVFHIRYNAAHRGAEKDVFPFLTGENRPGVITYTATRWRHLLNPKKMPPGESPLSAADCYRFVLSNSDVDVCLCGPANISQMKEALSALDQGPLNPDEMKRIQFIGDHVHLTSKGLFG